MSTKLPNTMEAIREELELALADARCEALRKHVPIERMVDLRPALPWTLYRAPVRAPRGDVGDVVEHRVLVLWDEDDDERVVDYMRAVFADNADAFRACLMFAEHEGMLHVVISDDRVSDVETLSCIASDPPFLDRWTLSVSRICIPRAWGDDDNELALYWEDGGCWLREETLCEFVRLSRLLGVGWWQRRPWRSER